MPVDCLGNTQGVGSHLSECPSKVGAVPVDHSNRVGIGPNSLVGRKAQQGVGRCPLLHVGHPGQGHAVRGADVGRKEACQ